MSSTASGTDHNNATGPGDSCPDATHMASKVHGVIRDCPARLRPKYRVHAPEKVEGTLCPQPI